MFSVIVRFLYSAVMLLLSVALAPFFLLKARGRSRLLERFGFWNLPEDNYVWFHGASLGEINGLVPVIKSLRATDPNIHVLLTATSVTGLDRGASEADHARLLTFDSPWLLRFALGRSRIRLLVITETELWPGLISEAKRRGAVVCLVNAIVSDYSIRWYRLFRPLVKRLLGKFDVILCSSEISRARFIELGARESVAVVTGNTKYDLHPSVASETESLLAWRKFFSSDNPVLVLGSLRPGEELLWFPEISRCLKSGQALSVVVAPRHKEKFDFFAQKLRDNAIPFRQWSKDTEVRPTGVVLLDTYGVLETAYSFADVAFVGGSLVDWGGHNPLEPACYGAFVAMGPYARKVSFIVADLEASGALTRLTSSADIRALLEDMQNNIEALRLRGRSGRAVWQAHKGASEKIVDRLQKLAS